MNNMSIAMSLRLPEEIIDQLDEIAESTERTKSYLIKKAIERYLEEYADYEIALDRMNDPHDKIISSKELRRRLGSKI